MSAVVSVEHFDCILQCNHLSVVIIFCDRCKNKIRRMSKKIKRNLSIVAHADEWREQWKKREREKENLWPKMVCTCLRQGAGTRGMHILCTDHFAIEFPLKLVVRTKCLYALKSFEDDDEGDEEERERNGTTEQNIFAQCARWTWPACAECDPLPISTSNLARATHRQGRRRRKRKSNTHTNEGKEEKCKTNVW